MKRSALLFVSMLLSAGVLSADAGTWKIDPSHSTAEFTVKHMMIANVRGRFQKVAGTVEGDPADPTGARLNVTIDASSIDTAATRRDEHLRSADFFDVANHPEITYVSKRIAKGADGRLQVFGDLTIRGVTRPVTLTIEEISPVVVDSRGTNRVGAQATTRINRQDFGVNWNRSLDNGGVVVSDEVRITLEVELVREKPVESPSK